MAEGIITKVQIKQLPPKSSVDDTNLFIVDDGITTFQVTTDDIAEYISTNEEKFGMSFNTGIQNNPVLIQG